jgi:MoaA/NifB/PqqE/SkfB family radical SAM enzyme
MSERTAIDWRRPETLLSRIGSRAVFVWGARHEGYAVKLALARHGVKAAGFVDSSLSLRGTTAFGLAVSGPEGFFAARKAADSFILIASGFFSDEISERCEAEGWRRGQDYAVYRDLRRFSYQVDVAGVCNLRCISCPRGNWPRHRKPGFMSAATYRSLLDKILAEDPWTGLVTLYNWGEPLLNKALPEILRATRENGLLSAVSSNLAMKMDLEEVVVAGPDWFRVSNSGWGAHYEATHTGGKWELFLENCRKLSELRRQLRPEMIVEFFFHIYDHNRQDFPKLRALCDDLGFTLRYRHAALAPLDNVSRVVEGQALSEAAERTRQLQFLQVEEVMEIARAERGRPCFYLDHLWIDWDLSVAHCMEWYDPSLVLFDDFMKVSLDQIDAARAGSPHCRSCMERGIHRAYCVYGDEKLIAARSSIPVEDQG